MAEAIREVLQEDSRVILIGIDAMYGIPLEVIQELGSRVVFPPISENGYCGLAIGAAMVGLRPVVNMGTASFVFEAWPQIVNEAANSHFMSGGKIRVPVVFHFRHGIWGGAGGQHSHSPVAMLCNVPGLEIVLPSDPNDVKGLLKAAVESDNPTVLVTHHHLMKIRGPVPEGNYSIPLGKGDVKRPGKDVTVVATSFMVHRSLSVAYRLADQGIQVEVVDPRTLVPLDEEIILTSLEKTGRLVVVDECHRRCGVASEISAVVAERGLHYLKAPIQRVTTLDAPIPYSPPLEKFVEVTEERITKAIQKVLV